MGNMESQQSLIAKRLRMARELAGLSQGQVARELKLHRPSVSEIEAGRRRVSAEELSRMASLYDVSIAWLTGADSEEASDEHLARVELVARELSKLKQEDLDRLLELLTTLRTSQDNAQ